MTALLSNRGNMRGGLLTLAPSNELALGFPRFHSDSGEWGKFWPAIRTIENRHSDDDPDAPRLADAVVAGTRRLLRFLEDGRESLPTVMTGTCDATIVFEWHAPDNGRTFRSLDVLSENEAEEFVLDERGQPLLRTITF